MYLPLGPFRDYDSLAGAGAAVAVVSVWGLVPLMGNGSAPVPRGVGLAIAASVIVPFLLMLCSLADIEHGFARGLAIAAGPPQRNATQRASLLDWVGLRALNEERYDVAHVAFRDLCAETPIPHALKLWGASALIVGQPREAEQAFTQLVAGSATDPVGWYGLWMSAGNLGDTLVMQRAQRTISAWNDSGPEMRSVVEFLDHYPRLYAQLPGSQGSSPH